MKLSLSLLTLTILLLPLPEASAAPGVAPWNRNCIRFYAQWQKKPRHKAFAVVNSPSSQGCGGAWGAKSVNAAKKAAEEWCRKSSEGGANCRITAAE